MAGRLSAAVAFLVPAAALIVATLLTNIAVVLAVVGGVAGIVSTVFVVVRVRDLAAQTAPLADSIHELTGRVEQMEATLQGDE